MSPHRTSAARALLLSLPLMTYATLADEPKRVEVRVGESVSVGRMIAPICDDPGVAVLTVNAGLIVGKGEGETLCSGETAIGLRQVYRVVVKPAGKAPSTKTDAGTG